jgi:tetratricopeptide (TPR) repeat protein
VLAVVLAYANTLRAPFLFDDVGAVMENPTIRNLASLAIFQPPVDGSTTTGRPIVNATFALNYALSGDNVWSYHALNLAIHAAAALTLLSLLRRTFGSLQLKLSSFNSAAAALWAAALWALHPLQTESVTCIAQRTESLCGFFYLFTFYAFARATSPVVQPFAGWSALTPTRWLALSVVSCTFGMATKEVMVTAPVLVFLYDRTFVAGSFAAAWRARRGYYLALVATWFVLIALLALNSGARGASAGFGLGITPWNYLLTQAEALVLYLRLALWPHPLVLDYGTAVVRSLAEVWWQGPVVLALLAATAASLFSHRPSLRALGFAGAWFFVILSPSSSVVPLITQTMAEHRMYLPLAAPIAVAVVGIFARFPAFAAPCFAVLSLAALVATVARNHLYRDPVVIWSDNVARLPANPRGHHNLALARHHGGRAAESHAHFARAVALDPGYVTAHFNWAVALLAESRTAEALLHLDATVRLAPDHLEARRKLGLLHARAERLAPAAEHFRAVIRLVPNDADAHANLGNVLLLSGQPQAAIAAYETSLRLRPGDTRTHENLRIARDALR